MNFDDIPASEARKLKRSVFWKFSVLWRVGYMSVLVVLLGGAAGHWATEQLGLPSLVAAPLAMGLVGAAVVMLFQPLLIDPAIKRELAKRKSQQLAQHP